MVMTVFRSCVISGIFANIPSIFTAHNLELGCTQFRKTVVISSVDCDTEFFVSDTLQ